MSITRYGTGSTAGGGQPRPFARAVEVDGWLYVSGQVPAVDGEIISGGIVEQTRQTMRNVVAILEEAGYALNDVVRVGAWLEDPRDFWSFNKVFGEYFSPEHAPARACVQANMMVDCKVEIDCVAYKKRAKCPTLKTTSNPLWRASPLPQWTCASPTISSGPKLP